MIISWRETNPRQLSCGGHHRCPQQGRGRSGLQAVQAGFLPRAQADYLARGGGARDQGRDGVRWFDGRHARFVGTDERSIIKSAEIGVYDGCKNAIRIALKQEREMKNVWKTCTMHDSIL